MQLSESNEINVLLYFISLQFNERLDCFFLIADFCGSKLFLGVARCTGSRTTVGGEHSGSAVPTNLELAQTKCRTSHPH